MPLMELYGKNAMPDVDNLLTSFYQLDDEARSEIIATIKMKLQYHKDEKRLTRKTSEATKRTSIPLRYMSVTAFAKCLQR